MSNNGFEDMSERFGKLAKVDMNETSLLSMKVAAEYYAARLRPKIPKSLMTKKHAKDQLVVVVEKDKVVVRFKDPAFYWRFVENGTVNHKAQPFARPTFEANKSEIERIMTRKILKELE